MPGIRLFYVCILAALLGVVIGCGNDPYCPEGQSWCWAQCVDLMSDKDNCGSCDNACESHQSCIEGLCGCQEEDTDCGGSCVNLDLDFANCGSCGQECCDVETCVNGECSLSCPQGFTGCHDGECGFCANLSIDETNCGACDNACRADQVCNNGTCACFGSMQECGGACVDTLTDPNNCGVCGNACADTICVAGMCGDCFSPNVQCGVDCVDLNTSNQHCGVCFNACDTANGFVCRDGECECFFGEECIAGVCSNLNNDEANCGTCGNACRGDQVCNGGECECVVDMTECGDPPVCVDTRLDQNHCGTCDNQCPVDEYCVSGICGDFCPPPWALCGSDCVDLQTSNSHCGSCDNSCDVATGLVCVSGVCDCTSGLTYCANDEVCTDLNSDEQHCGSCAHSCWPYETCISGMCLNGPFFYPDVTCPENGLPSGMTMQCAATMHYIGGNTEDVTDKAEWYQEIPGGTDCTHPGDLGCGAIYSVERGLVTASENTGLVGDREYIYARYLGGESNQWNIQLIPDYLCDVKIVPEQYSFEEFDKNDDLTLPYLADASNALEWRLHAVAILRGNEQCNQGGPFHRELAADSVDWQLAPIAGVATIDAQTGILEEVHQSSYPTGNLEVTVHIEYQDGADVFTDDMQVTIVPLTNTNWSLATEPTGLIIPAGMIDGFRAFLDFDINRVDVTHLFVSGSSWMSRSMTELGGQDLVVEDSPGYVTNQEDQLFGMWGITAGSNEGSTTVRLTMDDGQVPPHTEQADVAVDVDSAMPRYCKIFESDGTTPASSEAYPEGHPAVQYRAMACMSTTTCDPDTGPFDTEITGQDWGNGWMVNYQGTGGLLGFIDAYGSASPGLYHIPTDAPQNPNPGYGMIQYQFGPGATDLCETEVSIYERYLCRIDLTPDMTRRLWWDKADGTAEVLLPNMDGITQEFFVYGIFGVLSGTFCDEDNQYDEALPYGGVDSWEYYNDDTNGDGTGANPIFGINGVDVATGVGTCVSSLVELNRVEEIRVFVTSYAHVLSGGGAQGCTFANGCWDTVTLNACGVLPTVPDRQLVSTFSETDGYSDLEVEIYAGDTSTKVYGISRYESPVGGCYAVAGGDVEYYLDESHEANVKFYSQSSSTASIDHDGVISANSPGQTTLEVNWDEGPVEDTLPIVVLPAP